MKERNRQGGRWKRTDLRVLAACLLISLIAACAFYYMLEKQSEKSINRISATYAERTENLINSVFHKTDVLSAAVKLENGNITESEFNEIAKIVYKKDSGIRGVQYMPGAVVTYSYPVKGNEAVIGKNFLKIPERKKDCQLAIDTKSIALSGPYHLIQGGLGVVARNPVFLKDSSGNEYFWGFSAIILDLPEALDSVGLDRMSDEGYDYQLYSINENGERIVIAGNKKLNISRAVCNDISVPHHKWTLAVESLEPWGNLLKSLEAFLIGVLLSLLIWRYYGTLQKEKEAIDAKSMFFSNISHDMRTPLNAVIGFAKIAKSSDLSEEKRNEYLDKIQVSGNLLSGLINDTLTLSKAENGKLALHLLPCDTMALLDSIVIPVKAAADEKDIEFKVDSSGLPACMIMADRICVEKVFMNLLSNAVKYTPRGGHIQYTVSCVGKKDEELLIRSVIADDGAGISKEYLPHIFEPFSQENRSSSGSSGTGLGLSIVRNYVDLMSGTVDVQSEKGHGSVFTVELSFRAADEVSAVTSGNDDAAVYPLSGRRVLLAEDNALNSEIAVTLLQDRGMEVETASNGLEAVRKFAESAVGEYDAVLMDIRMPEMDGYDATRAIRALDRADASIPVIAMTADAFADDVQRCFEAGMNGHIVKPVDPDTLYSTLAAFIRQRDEKNE